MSQNNAETDVIEKHCDLCDEVTEWDRQQTAFGDGYRCECKRMFVEMEGVEADYS